jgi:hypothetical protein
MKRTGMKRTSSDIALTALMALYAVSGFVLMVVSIAQGGSVLLPLGFVFLVSGAIGLAAIFWAARPDVGTRIAEPQNDHSQTQEGNETRAA